MPPPSSARKRALDEPPDEALRRYVCIYPLAGYRQLAAQDNIHVSHNYARAFLRDNRGAVLESFEASQASMPRLQLSELQQHVDFFRVYLDDGAETALRALQYDHGKSAILADVQSILEAGLADVQSILEPGFMAMKRHLCIHPSSGYRALVDAASQVDIRATVADARHFLQERRVAILDAFEVSRASMVQLQMSDLQQHAEFLRGYLDHGAQTAQRALQYD